MHRSTPVRKNVADAVSRRELMRLLGIGGVATLFAGSLGGTSSLLAREPANAATSDAPMQGAGFFTFPLGELTVSVVSDGGFVMKAGDIFPDVAKQELETAANDAHISPDGFPGQINTLLVRHGNDVILIDTGAGRNFGPTAGYLLPNLARAGVKPEDVTHVVLSHAHPDHVGGLLTADGKPTFSRARVYVNKVEHDFWTGPDPKMPNSLVPADFQKQMIAAATKAFAGVKDSLEFVKPGDTVAGVVKLIEAYGHTPGHVALQVGAADGPKLSFLGDAIFILPLQVKHPEWHGFYDADPVMAADTRRKLFERVAQEKSLASSAHMPFPAVGYLDHDAGAFRWTAKPWSWGAEP